MIELDGESLRVDDVNSIARYYDQVSLACRAREAVAQSNKYLQQILSRNKPVYGINTGFGVFSDQIIPIEQSSQLSRNLILSHAVGTGPALEKDVVRAGILIRANTLAKGYSGIKIDVIDTLIALLNRRVYPVIPSQGSLGSSGDLCQLCHLALVFSKDDQDRNDESGWAYYNDNLYTGKECLKIAGIDRIVLGSKEGLAISNGASFSAAIAALAVYDSHYLLKIANAALALSMEALLGCSSAFDPRIQAVRGHTGQIRVASNVLQLIQGSDLINSTHRVQDAYSLRCAPQVHGAVYDTIAFCEEIISKEINAATDNPLIFNHEEVLSGGNFHGEPIGLAMDYLSIAMCELAGISERRIFRLIDEKLNGGLPPMLVDHPSKAGLNSGLMMPHYTAASLVLENQTLATPDTIRSLPTAGEQEDYNSNSMTAARHTRMIIDNTYHILAIEIYTACRALELRLRDMPHCSPGVVTNKILLEVKKLVSYRPDDGLWGPEIDAVREWLKKGELMRLLSNSIDKAI